MDRGAWWAVVGEVTVRHDGATNTLVKDLLGHPETLGLCADFDQAGLVKFPPVYDT